MGNAVKLPRNHVYAKVQIQPIIIFSSMNYESVKKQAEAEAQAGEPDRSGKLKQLDARQRQLLGFFEDSDFITAKDVGELLGVKGRMARILCKEYVEKRFLVIVNPSKKSRRYSLAKKWKGRKL